MVVGCTVVKESEKKEREALGKVEMTWRMRGEFVEGHVEPQIFAHRVSLPERAWNSDDVVATEASEGPSRRVRM